MMEPVVQREANFGKLERLFQPFSGDGGGGAFATKVNDVTNSVEGSGDFALILVHFR